jgi:hypothetical protein
MSDRLDPRLAPVERRLERLPATAPAAALRRRVLAAVDGVLVHQPKEKEKVPATKSRWFGKSSFPLFPDLVAGTFFPWACVAAVASGVVIVAACLASTAPVPRAPRITLVERLRIAGVAEEGLRESLIAAVAAASSPADSGPLARSAAITPAARAAVRVSDTRRLLEEYP